MLRVHITNNNVDCDSGIGNIKHMQYNCRDWTSRSCKLPVICII